MSLLRRFRPALKRAVELTAVGSGFDQFGLWLRGKRALILAYHNVVPDGVVRQGDRSLHLPQSDFRRQLDLLVRRARIISLPELLSGAWSASSDRVSVILTFDDAYRGTIAVALPELQARGIPATIFVAPGLLGDRSPWWDALANPGSGAPPPEMRRQILERGRGTLEDARTMAESFGCEWREMPELLRTATETELRDATRSPGVTLGSHSWSHSALPRLDQGDLVRELQRSRDWLRTRFEEHFVDVISYPYGMHSSSVRTAAATAGYAAGVTTSRGSLRVVRAGADYCLPRLNVPAGLSLLGLRLSVGWR